MPSPKTFSTPAVVIKRSNVGETDRVVTFLTEKKGKLVCIAKGVRKMKSSKRAYLEPGNLIKAFFVTTKSMPLLTQAELLNDFRNAKTDLKKIRQLSQVLEIIDKLFVEEEIEEYMFSTVKKILQLLNSPDNKSNFIKKKLLEIIRQLGYLDEQNQTLTQKSGSVLKLVEEIAEKPIRSWEYLQVKK